jgi:hypothetical protein
VAAPYGVPVTHHPAAQQQLLQPAYAPAPSTGASYRPPTVVQYATAAAPPPEHLQYAPAAQAAGGAYHMYPELPVPRVQPHQQLLQQPPQLLQQQPPQAGYAPPAGSPAAYYPAVHVSPGKQL